MVNVRKSCGNVRMYAVITIDTVVEKPPCPLSLPTAGDIFECRSEFRPVSGDNYNERYVPTNKTSVSNKDSATHVSKCEEPGIEQHSMGLLYYR